VPGTGAQDDDLTAPQLMLALAGHVPATTGPDHGDLQEIVRVRVDVRAQAVDTAPDRSLSEQRMLVQRWKHVGIVRLLAEIRLARGGAPH